MLYASSLSVFQSYDCTFFIISQLLCVLNVYLYIIIKKITLLVIGLVLGNNISKNIFSATAGN